MHPLPGLLALFALVACSSTPSGGSPASGSSSGTGSSSGGSSASDASSDAPSSDAAAGASDGAYEVGAATDAREEAPSVPAEGGMLGVNPCASCTAQQCLNPLEACGGSQACLSALQAFNACFGAALDAGASCGATFAATGPEASTLWQCMSTTCASSCG